MLRDSYNENAVKAKRLPHGQERLLEKTEFFGHKRTLQEMEQSNEEVKMPV